MNFLAPQPDDFDDVVKEGINEFANNVLDGLNDLGQQTKDAIQDACFSNDDCFSPITKCEGNFCNFTFFANTF